ncbi:MAG: methyltransferase [Dehalococcoidia bacterium]
MATTTLARNPGLQGMRWRRRASMSADAFLVVLFSFFTYVYFMRVLDGHFTSLVFAIEQSVLVGIYLIRRRPFAVTTRLDDWAWATLGGWLSLTYSFLEPGDVPARVEALGIGLQLAGTVLVMAGFLSLGRSFGIVAANRGLKSQGMYRVVRHPIYFAHAVTAAGLVVAEFSPAYLALWAAILFFQVLRIRSEERVLSASSDYAAYSRRVRWRMIPGLY